MKDAYKIKNVNFSWNMKEETVSNKLKYKIQRVTRGFDDTECLALNHTIIKFMLPRLKRFIVLLDITQAIPMGKDETEWKNQLQEYVNALTFLLYVDDYENEMLAKLIHMCVPILEAAFSVNQAYAPLRADAIQKVHELVDNLQYLVI